MGTSALTGFRFSMPANGATKDRTPGSSRPRKIPAIPKRRYSRSMVAMAWGERSRRPTRPLKRVRPYFRLRL
jgi:hypothetical protein